MKMKFGNKIYQKKEAISNNSTPKIEYSYGKLPSEELTCSHPLLRNHFEDGRCLNV